MFEVEYLRSVWIKKNGVNAHLVLCDWLNFGCPIDFAFSLCLSIITFILMQTRSRAKKRSLLDRLVNAVTMVTMMGLTWIFGYFLLIPYNVTYESVMQWLFTIFNVFQVMFVYNCYFAMSQAIMFMWCCLLFVSNFRFLFIFCFVVILMT